MILHANAALSVRQRQRLVSLVLAGMTITAAAIVVGCSRQTASKWIGRARRGEGLADRSSRPRRSPRRTPLAVEQAVLRARSELRCGPHPLGWALGLAASTVHAILRRHGCSRLRPPLPREQVVRYERERAGELLHIDIKKLGRIILRDTASPATAPSARRARPAGSTCSPRSTTPSRLGFAAIYPDETADSALAFLTACDVSTAHGIGSSACSPTTAAASNAAGHEACEQRGSPSARPGPTGRRQTAKPNASSAHCSSSGPTPTPTTTNTSAPPHSHQRSTPTIASGDTAPSADSHRSSASTTSLGRTTRRASRVFVSHRSGEGAFESRAVGGLAVRRQHELHGLVEQRPQPGRDLLDRDAFR